MVRVLTPAVTALLVLVLAAPGSGAPGSEFTVGRGEIELTVSGIAAAAGPLSWVEGEIIVATRERCLLGCGGGERSLAIPSGCPVYANGRPAAMNAIRPVAPGACYWARIWLDPIGVPVLVEAVYCGGELTILALSPAGLTGRVSETGAVIHLAFAAGCPVAELAPGRLVYVLLDLQGRVRRAFDLRQEMSPITSK